MIYAKDQSDSTPSYESDENDFNQGSSLILEDFSPIAKEKSTIDSRRIQLFQDCFC